MKKKILTEAAYGAGFLLFLALLKTSVLGFYLVPSASMLPSVIPGDRVLTNKLAYGLWLPFGHSSVLNWSAPNRGDVILFSLPDKEGTYIKRVIGIPGDEITFKEGNLTLNGESVHETHILSSQESGRTFFEDRRFVVPPQAVFVLGDNRDNSEDSRDFGYVKERNIYGRASYILFSTLGSESWLPEFQAGRFLQRLN